MSQADLAAALDEANVPGMYPQTITKIEQGRRAVKFAEGIALCHVLDAKPSELYDVVPGETLARRLLREAEWAWASAAISVDQARSAENELRHLLVEVGVGTYSLSEDTLKSIDDAILKIHGLLGAMS